MGEYEGLRGALVLLQEGIRPLCMLTAVLAVLGGRSKLGLFI